MKKLLLIINPLAGRQQAQTDLYKMVKIFSDHDYEVTVYPTRARLDCTRKVAEDAGQYDLVACCGGDGTLNEVLQGASGYANAAVGCVPCGSGNDYVRNFGAAGQAPFLDFAAQLQAQPGDRRRHDIL